MFGDGFLVWIMSTLAMLDPGTEMVKTNQVAPMRNMTTMAQMVFRQAQGTTSKERPFTIVVEGNVGSGKSTFLKIMEKLPGVKAFPEPVKKWQEVGTQNLLKDMYADPKRWTTTFQLYSSLTRTQIGLASKDSASPVTILERSLYSERFCFVQMLLESGVLTPGEFALLDRWFHTLTRTSMTGMVVDMIVYIRTDPDILMERINARGRQEEEGLPLTILKDLHTRHEDWLIHGKYPIPAPVIVMDNNLKLEQFEEVVMKWADTLKFPTTLNSGI
eukprot:GFUD01032735.1.p1 GENE.GFUD01032735.1~~GFUD01032735.1.p1  ORF type:complete len:274 (-),score=79.28 GFUD01032735.1:265-1086(-)